MWRRSNRWSSKRRPKYVGAAAGAGVASAIAASDSAVAATAIVVVGTVIAAAGGTGAWATASRQALSLAVRSQAAVTTTDMATTMAVLPPTAIQKSRNMATPV